MARSHRSRLRWRHVPRARRQPRPMHHPALRTLLSPSNIINNLPRLCDRLYRRTRPSLPRCRRRRTTRSRDCRLRLRACRSATTTRTCRRSRRRLEPLAVGVTSPVRTRTRRLVGGDRCLRNRLRGRTGGVESNAGVHPRAMLTRPFSSKSSQAIRPASLSLSCDGSVDSLPPVRLDASEGRTSAVTGTRTTGGLSRVLCSADTRI